MPTHKAPLLKDFPALASAMLYLKVIKAIMPTETREGNFLVTKSDLSQ